MTTRFQGRTAVVTGAASGMGRSIAVGLSAEGATVLLLDVDTAGLEAVGKEIEAKGGAARAIGIDISDPAAVAAFAGQVASIDILINNAGIFSSAGLTDTNEALWDRIMGVNLKAPYLLARALMPALLKAERGVVVNVASAAGLVGGAGGFAYTTSKHGVIGLTRAISAEFSPAIRCNAVLPGATDTPIARREIKPEHVVAYVGTIPAKRFPTTEEVAKVVLFVASDDASYMYGSPVVVDGGWSAV